MFTDIQTPALLIAAVVGAGIGAGLMWLWLTRGGQSGGPALKQLEQEHQRFHAQVNDHFIETAELINQLTDSYKKVFDHLSVGAHQLVEEQAKAERLPEVSNETIRLHRIGKAAPAASESDTSND
jgi:uncharacterized membrane-anchored protein YhcB (DUF1043 family)